MIRSMTGFGRSDFEVDGLLFEIEMRSVNNRYLDARAKLPRPLSSYESVVKAAVQARLQRGKVDVTIAQSASSVAATQLKVDRGVAEQYVLAAAELVENFDVSGSIDVATLLGMPGVTRMGELELADDTLGRELEAGVGRALDALDEMREREGEALASDFTSRLGKISEIAHQLESRSGEVLEAVREKLRLRTKQLEQETGLLDEARLHQEVVIAADRLDITEELVRLRSHVDQFHVIVGEAGRETPVGRRLDFLLQEMGREANTVGSKASDAPLAHLVVELKTELERLREQVQNVE
ncbi:MAG: YicC/YloC family endoribonuclease [Myxococcota bacterium]|nr:YicC/YloC family endoribonuclease [Myxococcota bacterium]